VKWWIWLHSCVLASWDWNCLACVWCFLSLCNRDLQLHLVFQPFHLYFLYEWRKKQSLHLFPHCLQVPWSTKEAPWSHFMPVLVMMLFYRLTQILQGYWQWVGTWSQGVCNGAWKHMMLEFAGKSPCCHPGFGQPFIPYLPLWVRFAKLGNFIESGYEMLKLSI